MIAIVDYGIGNLRSLVKVFDRLRIPACVSSTPRDLVGATGLVLPGVGHFGTAMDELRRKGLIAPLTDAVQERRVPLLGVCLGMQLLFAGSEEGNTEGLGWMTGTVCRLAPADGQGWKVPNMGWRALTIHQPHPLFPDPQGRWRAYFVHSYHAIGVATEQIAATTEYAGPVVAAVRAGHIMGVQFHPEKSHRFGRALLGAFARG